MPMEGGYQYLINGTPTGRQGASPSLLLLPIVAGVRKLIEKTEMIQPTDWLMNSNYHQECR